MAIAINPRYAYFTKPPINYHNTKCFTTISDPLMIPAPNSPITFVIQSDNTYINFAESYLRFKLKLCLANGDNLPQATDNHVCFIPNIFHSLFGQVRVRVNDFLVSPSSDLYAFKAFIEETFSLTKEKEQWAALTCFFNDVGQQNTFDNNNPNWAGRAGFSNRSRWIELSGYLCVDF